MNLQPAESGNIDSVSKSLKSDRGGEIDPLTTHLHKSPSCIARTERASAKVLQRTAYKGRKINVHPQILIRRSLGSPSWVHGTELPYPNLRNQTKATFCVIPTREQANSREAQTTLDNQIPKRYYVQWRTKNKVPQFASNLLILGPATEGALQMKLNILSFSLWLAFYVKSASSRAAWPCERKPNPKSRSLQSF